MIERILLIKLNDEHAHPEAREDARAHTATMLRGLPRLRSVRVGVPADDEALKSWDLAVVLTYDTLEGVEASREHADYVRWRDEYVLPRAVVTKAWSFEVP